MNKSKLDGKILTLAILKALEMWSDLQYANFLPQNEPGHLDKKWFEWFIGDWNVVRSLDKDKSKRELVRRYLDERFRQKLARCGPRNLDEMARCIDKASRHIKKQKWSSKVGKPKKHCLPISLVSKIGFILSPNTLVPYDALACRGFEEFTEKKIKRGNYSAYHKAFKSMFRLVRRPIGKALSKRWVTSAAYELGCPVKLHSPAMRRKVFDNYLMEIARRSDERNPALARFDNKDHQ